MGRAGAACPELAFGMAGRSKGKHVQEEVRLREVCGSGLMGALCMHLGFLSVPGSLSFLLSD